MVAILSGRLMATFEGHAASVGVTYKMDLVFMFIDQRD